MTRYPPYSNRNPMKRYKVTSLTSNNEYHHNNVKDTYLFRYTGRLISSDFLNNRDARKGDESSINYSLSICMTNDGGATKVLDL